LVSAAAIVPEQVFIFPNVHRHGNTYRILNSEKAEKLKKAAEAAENVVIRPNEPAENVFDAKIARPSSPEADSQI
jgi:hypothetical protein